MKQNQEERANERIQSV